MEELDTEEARAMLADIYGWFTEGFETADLKDARRCSTSWETEHALREMRK